MDFFERMKSSLKEDYPAFLASMDRPFARSVRLNTRRMDRDRFLDESGLDLERESPFTRDAWIVSGSWGLHPLHVSGAMYLQEPSASAPVDILDVQAGDRVLDLCAAPGSKSTQILREKPSFLVCNELDPKRASVLLSNLERTGAVDFALSRDDACRTARRFPGMFDKVLVDAPCSGEGMIKKHDLALTEWSEANIRTCAARQADILDAAYEALACGGVMVYSTCTYAREENEDQVRAFLERHPDMTQEPIHKPYGRPDFDQAGGLRIFPMDGGEGQFAARLRKAGDPEDRREPSREKTVRLTALEQAFLQDMQVSFPYYYREKTRLYGMNQPFLKGTWKRQGVFIGETVKTRFEPAHAFFMAADCARKAELDDAQLDAFLHGQELAYPMEKGYVQVTWHGQPMGFAKSTGKVLKNKLPKGLRLLAGSHVRLPEAGSVTDGTVTERKENQEA